MLAKFSHPMYQVFISVLPIQPALFVTQIRGHAYSGHSSPFPTTVVVHAFILVSRKELNIFFPLRLASNCGYTRYQVLNGRFLLSYLAQEKKKHKPRGDSNSRNGLQY